MATIEAHTHIADAQAKQLVADLEACFDDVAEAEQKVEDAQVDSLRARFVFGCEVHDALAEVDDEEQFLSAVKRRIDYGKQYIRDHARFAKQCYSEFDPRFDPPVEGYIAHCQDHDHPLSWRYAYNTWIRDSKSEEDKDKSQAGRLKRRIEKLLEKLDDATEELSEIYLERKDDLDEEERRELEGVITQVDQAVKDAKRRKAELEGKDEQRVTCEPYLRYVKDHACCLCGVDDDTVVPHHPNEAYPDDGGTGTKVSDFKTVPVCYDCHQDLEETPDPMSVWEEWDKDPRIISNHLQAKVKRRLDE